MYFNWAQTFHLDRSVVKNATEVAITRVDLFFRAIPPESDNKSGIFQPGVEILIVPTLNGIPVINQMGAYRPTEPTEHGAKFAFYSGGQIARVEYDQIQASGNAITPTPFLFPNPVFVKTDKEYAVIVKFDGNENFVLWSSVAGDKLAGTDKISPGPSSRFIGTLYQFIDDPNKPGYLIANSNYAYTNTTISTFQANNPALIYTANVTTFEALDTNYLQSNWSPLASEDLKFKVYVAKYSHDGVSVASINDFICNAQYTSSFDRFGFISQSANGIISNNVTGLVAPVQTTEYVVYDIKNTTKDNLYYGEALFQDGPAWPGGRATPLTVTCGPTIAGANSNYSLRIVQANGSYILPGGATFTSTGGLANVFSNGDFLIVKHGSNNFMRRVHQIISNTQILVDAPFEETITGATLRISPIGFLYDVAAPALYGKASDMFTMYNSTANSNIRFTSFSLDSVTINDDGTGYSNSNYIRISGHEEVGAGYAVQGNYPAYANIVTDATGNITAVHISNSGAGFVNTSWLVGANIDILVSEANGHMTENPSAGTGANLTFNVGSTIRSFYGLTEFANCHMINLEVVRMKPEITVNNPLGASFTIRHRTLYHSVPDSNTASGKAYYINTPEEAAHTDTWSKIFKGHRLNAPAEGKTPVLTSRSNEFSIRFANGAVSDANTHGDVFSNTAVFLFDLSSNSDYQTVFFDPEIVTSHYSKYIINQEYTGEHTNHGEAWSKHVATKITLQKDTFAEDALIYLTAYRPANTNFKIYARIHNSQDEEAFDDHDWTLLELVDGVDVYSSKDNDSSYIELTYNFPAYPNSDFTCNGSVTLTQGNAHIFGVDTVFGPYLTINDGGTAYVNGDIISFTTPGTTYQDGDGNWAYKNSVNATGTIATNPSGVITGITLINVGVGWNNQSNVSTFTVAHANGITSVGTAANVYFHPGLQANDLIKIYSPYVDWANTNYTTAVVNSVISNTHLTVKRTFGQLSANMVGNVNILNNSTTLNGQNTAFTTDFSVGDFIAVWANSSVYETHQVVSITDANTLIMDSNGTFANTDTFYARVTPDTFMNTSLNVAGLKVDRIAYPHQAFNHAQYDNVARYYNKSMMEFDTYDTLQLKIVFLGPSEIIVPKIDDVRGVLVTA